MMNGIMGDHFLVMMNGIFFQSRVNAPRPSATRRVSSARGSGQRAARHAARTPAASCPVIAGWETRRVQLVRGGGRGVSTNYRGHTRRVRGFGADAACPVSTVRGTRRVRLVLGKDETCPVSTGAGGGGRGSARGTPSSCRIPPARPSPPAARPPPARRAPSAARWPSCARQPVGAIFRKRLQWSRKRARGAEGPASGPTAPKRCMRGPPFRAPCSSPSCSTCAQSPRRSHLSHACFPHPAPSSPLLSARAGAGRAAAEKVRRQARERCVGPGRARRRPRCPLRPLVARGRVPRTRAVRSVAALRAGGGVVGGNGSSVQGNGSRVSGGRS